MARKVDFSDRERMVKYVVSKIQHGVDEFEFEGATKDCVTVIPCAVMLEKIRRADDTQINKWFRIKDNSVHVCVMDFRKGKIATRQFMAGGRFEDRPMRIGDWADGERQKAAEANKGRHNGNAKGHWFDYSYVNAVGVRIRVEVKHCGAWFEPNKEGH